MSAVNEPSDDIITGLLRQSYAGAVRQRLLEIERAVQSGQRHESIVQVLHQKGMKASMGTFRKSLSRARIWWRRHLLMQIAATQALTGDQGLGRAMPKHSVITQSGESTHNQERDIVLHHQQKARGPQSPSMRSLMPVDKDRSNAQVQSSQNQPAAGVRGVDLDQFFQRKSVFTKS